VSRRGGERRGRRAGAAAPRPRTTRAAIPAAFVTWPVFGAWLACVVAVATRHEMWRDEVRALSVATAPGAPGAVLATWHGEGHPFTWYVLLRCAYAVFHTPLVLPVLGIAAAAAAVWLVLRHAPWPPAMRALFVFGALPLYEYSVMTRNYGIGMLALFATCAAYERRFERPLVHGLLLLLLANTSAHAAIVAGALAAAWALEAWRRAAAPGDAAPARAAAGIGLAFAGVALCVAQTLPQAGTAVTGVGHAPLAGLAGALALAVVRPGQLLGDVVLGGLPPVLLGLDRPPGPLVIELAATAFLALTVVRLRRHADLVAALVLVTLGINAFFRAVYPGYLRHVGLAFLAVLALDWVARRRERGAAHAVPRAWTAAFVLVLALHAVQGVRLAARDWGHAMSSSRAFAELVHADPAYADAIVVGEPDYVVESLPYYAANRWYSVEQRAFVRWVRFDRGTRDSLSLGQVLDACDSLARRHGVPVLLALGHRPVLADPAGALTYRYGWRFTWTAAERERLMSATQPLAGFLRADGDEDYVVFRVPPAR